MDGKYDDQILFDISKTDKITSFLKKGATEIKLLGVNYDFKYDYFRINLKDPEPLSFTKRGLSSASASFYDPMGFILPLVMMLSIFLQRVYSSCQRSCSELIDAAITR
ncbi:hypothetical protein ACFFRR_009865 [Megaselia abdita]